MIPYYNPHFNICDIARTLLCRNAEEKLIKKFQEVTEKKYILITSSCRSALYLAYKAIGKNGKVHTSPLTCKVALMPILASGNTLWFHDIKLSNWTIDPESISSEVREDSIAIQAIHLGGFPCDMPSLKKIARDHGLVLIEDCAQGYGAQYKGAVSGTLGDISCFTLTKNLFGLGGGILATNNEEWYLAAKNEQSTFRQEKFSKMMYRIFISILASHRSNRLFETIYQNIKGVHIGRHDEDDLAVLRKELKKPPKLYAKSMASRIVKIEDLMNRRIHDAKSILNSLDLKQDMIQVDNYTIPSYTKLFVLGNQQSGHVVKGLNRDSVEAMHLEHKHGVYYQEKLLSFGERLLLEETLPNYTKIHDRIFSIPLLETIADKRLIALVNSAIRSSS